MHVGERVWFERWVSSVQSKLDLYEKVFDDLYLRPADLGSVLETGTHRDILSDALRNHAQAWADLPALLRRARSLPEILRALFGEEVPLVVALTTLKELLRDTQTSGGAAAETLAQEIAKRGGEVADVGVPGFLWVVTVCKGGKMLVSVGQRSAADSLHVGLVKVVDVRQTKAGRQEG